MRLPNLFNVTETDYADGTKQLLDLEQSQGDLAKADSAYKTARAQTLMQSQVSAYKQGTSHEPRSP